MAKAKKDKLIEAIEGEVLDFQATEMGLRNLENELMENDHFRQWLELQRTVKEEGDELWKRVGDQMIKLYADGKIDKTLKFDWGTLTVRDDKILDIDESALPRRYWKKVPNTTLIRNDYDLMGSAPKGVKVSKKYTFTKSLKK
jgi:hypothetical protein